MKKSQYNVKNERMKFQYRKHISRVQQKDKKTVMSVLKNIRTFEEFIGFAGFESFNDSVADKYIADLFNKDISLPYISNNIRDLKEFLRWLERQNGYRTKINYNHIDYLNLTRNQQRQAKSSHYKHSYKFEQILTTIRQMPTKTDKDKRDVALISLQAMCALRINELRTVTLQNIIEEDGVYFLHVTPKNMAVKFAKTRQAVFLDLGKDILQNVVDWRDYLISLGFKKNDPLFPAIDNRFNQFNLLEQSINKRIIQSDVTIRNVFKDAFVNAGFEYINPHSFRRTIALYAQNQSPAFMNAVRQNLGHSSIDTTFNSYGSLSFFDQAQALKSLLIS